MTTPVTAGALASKLEQMLALAAMLDPRIALASAGFEVLKDLFSSDGELSTMLAQVYAETAESAPDVAQAVSAFYTAKGDAMAQSFKDHPGS
jgi:hypothetical protein